MSRPVVEFWFEFASTYSYLSVMRIERAAQAAGVDVKTIMDGFVVAAK